MIRYIYNESMSIVCFTCVLVAEICVTCCLSEIFTSHLLSEFKDLLSLGHFEELMFTHM